MMIPSWPMQGKPAVVSGGRQQEPSLFVAQRLRAPRPNQGSQGRHVCSNCVCRQAIGMPALQPPGGSDGNCAGKGQCKHLHAARCVVENAVKRGQMRSNAVKRGQNAVNGPVAVCSVRGAWDIKSTTQALGCHTATSTKLPRNGMTHSSLNRSTRFP